MSKKSYTKNKEAKKHKLLMIRTADLTTSLLTRPYTSLFTKLSTSIPFLFACGNGEFGVGLPRNLQIGSQPSLKSATSSLSFGAL